MIMQATAAEPQSGAEPRIAAYDPTPHLSPKRELLVRIVAVIALAFSTYYVYWRWAHSLNLEALWFSVPLALAETYGLITAYFMAFTVWRLPRRTVRPAPPGLSVDVYITCYDESLEILRRTAVGARGITYPHRTYMLDDGKRDEVKAMAEELGIGYIRRAGNEHAKAGNLNHAFKVTDGEFILQLDADHVPLPYILDRLLGFFDDPDVAFVQSPQDFYNTDSFTHEVNEEARRVWEEQRIFFSLIQPGKDHWNAAFFCGSCGVIRRQAIEEIGGFSTLTITEDMETSMILHGRGWKSVYYGESLAYGLAPASAGAFHVQRLRWGQGSMQILRRLNPLTYPGLTLAQRICYFSSVTSYLDGFQKLILYAAPLVFFFTGIFPIRASNGEFLVRFVPYLVLSLISFELLARGTGYLWIADRYNMAKFWTYVLAVSGFFAKGKLKFNVTPKGKTHVPFKTYAPQLVLMAVTVLSVVWALLAAWTGLIRYDRAGWGSAAFFLNLAWAVWNFSLALFVVRMSLRMRQQRSDHRFADRIPIRVQMRGRGGRRGRTTAALTEDLNASGVRFRSAIEYPVGTEVRVTLPLATRNLMVKGEILESKPLQKGRSRIFVHRVRFVDVPQPVRDSIELHCTQHSVPIDQLRLRNASQPRARKKGLARNVRSERRRRVDLPVLLDLDDGRTPGGERGRLAFMEDVSPSGARLVTDEPIAPDTLVHFIVPGTRIRGHGRTVFSRALHTPIGVRFSVGVQRVGAGLQSDTTPGWRPMKRAAELILGR
jgi:cellulose synthase (UDP-forming)